MTEQGPDVEIAWAAGFYDGEGCTSPCGLYLRMYVGQAEPTTLERFARAVEAGTVNRLVDTPTNARYMWAVAGRRADPVVERLWPFLSEPKRRQILRVRELVQERRDAAPPRVRLSGPQRAANALPRAARLRILEVLPCATETPPHGVWILGSDPGP